MANMGLMTRGTGRQAPHPNTIFLDATFSTVQKPAMVLLSSYRTLVVLVRTFFIILETIMLTGIWLNWDLLQVNGLVG